MSAVDQLPATVKRNRDFEHGVVAAASGGGLGLVALYTMYAPTADLRARIPFLLDMSGGGLSLVAFGLLFILGLAALLLTASITKRALSGAALGSLGNLLLLSSGVLSRILPPFEHLIGRWIAFLVGTVGVVLLLVRQRRINRREDALRG